MRGTLRIAVRVRLQLVEAGTAQASTRTERTRRGALGGLAFDGVQRGEFVIEGTWRGRSQGLDGRVLAGSAFGVALRVGSRWKWVTVMAPWSDLVGLDGSGLGLFDLRVLGR